VDQGRVQQYAVLNTTVFIMFGFHKKREVFDTTSKEDFSMK
jgi:hypothetical protein